MEIPFRNRGFVRPDPSRSPDVIPNGLGAGDPLGVDGARTQKHLGPPANGCYFSPVLNKGSGNVKDLLTKAQFFRAGPAGNDQPLVFHWIELANWGVWVDLVSVKACARGSLERGKDHLIASLAKTVHGKEDFHVLEPVRNEHQTFWLHRKNLVGTKAPIPASDPQAKTCFFYPNPVNLTGGAIPSTPKQQDPASSFSNLPFKGTNFSSGKTVS